MIGNSGNQYHIKLSPGDTGKFAILPGDPGRVQKIAEMLENPIKVAQNREYTTYNGYLTTRDKKVLVTVTSTGIGGPSAAIAIEELIKCGVNTFIRVGTSGAMDFNVLGGDIVIAQAAIRGDGTSREYLTEDYPAVADFFVTKALYEAALTLSDNTPGNRCHIGVVQSKDSFYGETNPEEMPVSNHLDNRWQAYIRSGCLVSEMEAATLMSVGLARKVRVGAILTAIWNIERTKENNKAIASGLKPPHFNPEYYDNTRAIKCALKAIEILALKD